MCHPFYYRESTLGKSVNTRVMMYVIPVIILSVLLNVPKFLETELLFITETEDNSTISYVTYDLTDLRQDPDYIRFVFH